MTFSIGKIGSEHCEEPDQMPLYALFATYK